ncbi:iron-containing alcohol dehydrogenase [Mycobacterium uberis]|nr:iron-containing alcohol dehydrogenase [Mycobacterium uberis]
MRSQRYFLLLDTLDSAVTDIPAGPVSEEPTPATIDTAYKQVRKAAKVGV